jgi:hypothetical protein
MVSAVAVVFAVQRQIGFWAGVFGGMLLAAGVVASIFAKQPLTVTMIGLICIWASVALLDFIFPIVISVKSTAIAFAFGVLFAGPLVHAAHWRSRGAAVAVFLACLIALQYIDWDPRKPFRRTYARIHRGMTLADMNRAFRKQFGGALPVHHKFGGSVTYTLDKNNGRYNADLIVVTMENGLVVKADYLPD